jgi:phosphomethylpyrimidine synthase
MSTQEKNLNTANLSDSAQVDQQSIQPFPRSQKIYVQGSRADIRVPMREISLDITPTEFGGEINAPVLVYDTSGPYTDPSVTIDVRQGLGDVRSISVGSRLPAKRANASASYHDT